MAAFFVWAPHPWDTVFFIPKKSRGLKSAGLTPLSQQILVLAPMLKKETLQELKEILATDYRQNLSDGEVFDIGQSLIQFFGRLSEWDQKNKNMN